MSAALVQWGRGGGITHYTVLPKLKAFLELSLEITYKGNFTHHSNLQIQYTLLHIWVTRTTLPVLASSHSLHLPANSLGQFPKIKLTFRS